MGSKLSQKLLAAVESLIGRLQLGFRRAPHGLGPVELFLAVPPAPFDQKRSEIRVLPINLGPDAQTVGNVPGPG